MYSPYVKNQLLKASEFANHLEENKKSILEILINYETYEAAYDEFDRSIKTLRGLDEEFSQFKFSLKDLYISTIFPLNLPLYSLILFGVVPSIFAKHLFIRPPEVMQHVLEKLIKGIDLASWYQNISVHPTPRHIFIDLYARESDVILFTGKYQNALNIHELCPKALLIYNGSGVNPFVMLGNADLELAAHKAVEMRCFNSGQDCAGPDIFLVPQKQQIEFINKIEGLLKNVEVGDTKKKNVRVGPIMKASYVQDLLLWLDKHRENIVYGGEVNLHKRIVSPTIISNTLKNSTENDFHEFFAPVFYILSYEDKAELKQLFSEDRFQRRAMYVSVFGSDTSLEKQLAKYCQVLKNQIVNDIEIGNKEYGGYGREANFVSFKNETFVGPLLISRDLHTHMKKNSVKKAPLRR